MTVDRVFGDHEADAMFEAIASRLALAAPHVGLANDFLQELREERRLIIARRLEVELALARLYDTINVEQTARQPARMSQGLYDTMVAARKALDG